MGWIGVDLDGTLAEYAGWKGPDSIGKPVPAMMGRVKRWISEGKEVKIFTARACIPEQIQPVKDWLVANGLPDLEITNVKDFGMLELWDDRCVTVKINTGEVINAHLTAIVDVSAINEKAMSEEIGKLREALKVYADISNWAYGTTWVNHDNGYDPRYTALKALGEINE